MDSRIFEIFQHHSGTVAAVKKGFCWPAFFLWFWWALAKRLWLAFLLSLLAAFLLGVVSHSAELLGLPLLDSAL